MDKIEVRKDYFQWLCETASMPEGYSLLLDKFRRMNFVWVLDRDMNRAEDGKTLRYQYARERKYSDEDRILVEEYLSGPCTILEFLVALARRIESDIMANGEESDRTSEWFLDMVDNLGLLVFDDKHYNENEADYILHRFMSRKYKKNGDGNVFKLALKGGPEGGPDFRNIEIWLQAQTFLVNKIGL